MKCDLIVAKFLFFREDHLRTHASQEKLTEEEAAAHIEVIPGT